MRFVLERTVTLSVVAAAILAGGAARAEIPAPPPIECLGDESTLQLQQNNIVLHNVRWRIPGSGEYGCAHAVPHREDTGHFWFFGPDNIELTCKALDGRALTGAYWVFCGALTNVEWWLEAVDNGNPGNSKQYYNPPRKMASFGDVTAIRPGGNRAPVFDHLNCGGTFYVGTGRVGSIWTYVQDPDGDPVVAQVELAPTAGAPSVAPQWSNPVTGTGADLLLAFQFPDHSGEYLVTIRASDGKVLIPTRCTYRINVYEPPR